MSTSLKLLIKLVFCKPQKHLLKRRLADAVVADGELALRLLHHCKHVRPAAIPSQLHRDLGLVLVSNGHGWELAGEKVLERTHVLLRSSHHDVQALAKAVLEPLQTANALKPAVDHDCQPRAQRLTLLH